MAYETAKEALESSSISDGLKNDIRTLLEKVKNGITDTTKAVVEKVMRFVKTVTIELTTVNLKTFFVTDKNLYADESDFQQFLQEVLQDNVDAPIGEVTYHWHTNTESAHDDVIWPEIGEVTIDMNTPEGMSEAHNRLNYLCTEINKQSKGEAGTLLNNGYANVIGIFKLKSGRVFTVFAFWYSGNALWDCYGFEPRGWNAGDQFLSRNGDAK